MKSAAYGIARIQAVIPRAGGESTLLSEVVVKVTPLRVLALNKPYFPRAISFLEALLSPNRRSRIRTHFVTHQVVNGIPLGETPGPGRGSFLCSCTLLELLTE